MATAVGLAMKITADSTGLTKGVQKTVDTLDSLGGATEKLDIIIALLAEAVELLAMQLDAMERTSIRNTIALGDLAKATTTVASSYQLLTKRNLALTAATTAGGSVLSGLGGTVMRGLAMQAVRTIVPMGALATTLYSVGAAAAASTPALVMLEDYVERIGVEASKLGTSFGFVQILEVAASRTGESIDSLRVAFTALLRNIEAARGGSASSIEAFEKLGVSAADLQSKTPEEIFKAIAVGLQGIEDPATRSAAALVVLGENGARLQPALKTIADSEADLVRFSAGLDTLDVARLNDLGEGFDKLQTATSGLGRQLILPFAGFSEGVSRAFADVMAGISSIAGPLGDMLSPFVDLLGAAVQAVGGLTGVILKLIGSALEPVALVFRMAGTAIEYVSDGLEYLFKTINSGIDSFREFFGLEAQFGSMSASVDSVTESIEEMTTASQDFYDEISAASDAAAEFGQAGFQAALELQQALEEINELKNEGEYTEEQAAEAARRANEEFEERIDLLKQAEKEAEKAAKREEKYKDKLANLQSELIRNDIKEREEAAKKRQADEEEYQSKLADMQAEFVRNQIARDEEIAAKREEYAKAEAEIEQQRLDALSASSNRALEASDIRSGGISSVIAMATGREDPAVAEAKKQVRKLDEIRNEIRNLGGTVELVGAA